MIRLPNDFNARSGAPEQVFGAHNQKIIVVGGALD